MPTRHRPLVLIHIVLLGLLPLWWCVGSSGEGLTALYYEDFSVAHLVEAYVSPTSLHPALLPEPLILSRKQHQRQDMGSQAQGPVKD